MAKTIKATKLNNPTGTRDLHPSDVYLQESVINKIKNIFEKYGGVPIETPILEYMNTVQNLYGDEFNKLVYELDDQGGEKLLLRYDLTVPFARYVATNGLINFKRYQIGRVYRRDRPQMYLGRYREFLQADFDIVGTDYGQSMQEIEILHLLDEILYQLLGESTYEIRINSRKVIFSILQNIGVDKDDHLNIISTIDKLDKMSIDDIQKDLFEKKVSADCSNRIIQLIHQLNDKYDEKDKESSFRMINFLQDEKLIDDEVYDEIVTIYTQLRTLGVRSIIIDPLLARGLDYYTGLVYEAKYLDPSIIQSSIAAGGRYDQMLERLGNRGEQTPAIGVSIGIERIITILEKKMDPIVPLKPKILVASVGKNISTERMKICLELRKMGVYVDTLYLKNPKMRSQLNRTLEQGIPYMIIIGEDEIKNGTITIKNISNREQLTMKKEDGYRYILDRLLD